MGNTREKEPLLNQIENYTRDNSKDPVNVSKAKLEGYCRMLVNKVRELKQIIKDFENRMADDNEKCAECQMIHNKEIEELARTAK